MDPDERHPLSYALPRQPREASRRRVFACFLPAAFVAASVVAFVYVERAYPDGDSRNFQVPCVAVVIAPAALWGVIAAGREAVRPRGGRAIAWGLAWGAALVVGTAATIWTIVHLDLFKHT